MRNRLNVSWHGKRTTARFPVYLWDMALVASALDDDALAFRIHRYLSSSDNALTASRSASDMVLKKLIATVNARFSARVPVTAPSFNERPLPLQGTD